MVRHHQAHVRTYRAEANLGLLLFKAARQEYTCFCRAAGRVSKQSKRSATRVLATLRPLLLLFLEAAVHVSAVKAGAAQRVIRQRRTAFVFLTLWFGW